MSVNVYQSARCNIPEGLNDRQHSCENFKLNFSYFIKPTIAPHRTHISGQDTTATCFGIIMPSSGSTVCADVRTSCQWI